MSTTTLYYKIEDSPKVSWRAIDIPNTTKRGEAVALLIKNTRFKHGFVFFWCAITGEECGVVLCLHHLNTAEDNLPLPIADTDDDAMMRYRALVEPGT